MAKKVFGLLEAMANAAQAVYIIGGSLTLMAVGLAVLWKWIRDLDTAQIVLLLIAIFCLMVIALTAFYTWWRRRNIESLPELLSQIDKMTLNWVDQFVPSLTEDENNRLLDDLGELLGIDFEQFRRAVASGDKDRINFQFQRIWKEYTRLMGIMSPTKQTGETLSSLVLIGGLLDSYNVGLKNIKVTTEYQKRYERIKSLQERTTLAETSIKINDYFFWSDGMYCLLLSIKPITSLYYLSNLLPAKAKATGVVLRPIIESHMTTLITAVRESIHKSKEDKK